MNTTMLILGAFLVVFAAYVLARAYRELHSRWGVITRRTRDTIAVLPPLAIGLWWIDILPLTYALAIVLVFGLPLFRRFTTTAAKVTRASEHLRRKSGAASTLDVAWHASAARMRASATVVRPSLANLTAWQRLRVPTSEFATLLVRAGGQWVWTLAEEVVLVFGGPRKGKSGWLADRIVDAPGAVLVTSTRTDLMDNTAPLRNGPSLVFNPAGLGGVPSTLTFDPLTGCADPEVARVRANDLLSPTTTGGGGDREYWNGRACDTLAMFMHAAALGGRTMLDVLRWVSDPDGAQREVTSHLRRGGSEAFGQSALQFITTNDRTRTSITSTIMPALGWLTSPTALTAARPSLWSVEEVLADRTAIYLLGTEETNTEPLVAALVGHIAREARQLAAHQPNGRLDPPLGLYLDEASRMAPDGLVQWTADMGGRGITIVALFQSRAQLLARWGRDIAATILNNAGAVMLFGGTKDRDDLEFWSILGGERDEPVTTTDKHGHVKTASTRKVRVLQPSEIRKLRKGQAIVFVGELSPVIGRARMVWKRRVSIRIRWTRFIEGWTARIVDPALVPVEQPLPAPIPLPQPSPTADTGAA